MSIRHQTVGLVAVAATAAFTLVAPAFAEQPATTLTTLLDKQQIQDMLVDYYGQLGAGRSDFGAYYIADGTLNVNGVTGQGEKGIEDLYKKVGAGTPKRTGVFRMVLSNVKVAVNGETATADSLWTGVISETLTQAPRFVEQGTEHDELVKRNGKWLFKHRVIMSDGGMQEMFLSTRKQK
jgi:hypothetical protein